MLNFTSTREGLLTLVCELRFAMIRLLLFEENLDVPTETRGAP
jgi:hypothetical protein